MWPELNRTISDLLVRADLELQKTDVYSVTHGIFVPPSGNMNDYLSLGMLVGVEALHESPYSTGRLER